MRAITRKVYMSLLTCIIVIFTMFATTYAWVGMLTTSTLGTIDLNLKTVKNEMPYHLMISSDGVNFADNVSAIDIQKQILKNQGYNYEDLLTQYNDAKTISSVFTRIVRLCPSTTKVLSDNTMDKFYSMDKLSLGDTSLYETQKYYKFDIYLSVESNEGNQASTAINANVVFTNIESLISGIKCSGDLVNSDLFSDLDTSNQYYSVLSSIPSSFSIDSSYAARVGFSVYNPIKISDTYSENVKPIKTVIYQGGTKAPSITDGKYSLGGILPAEENLAIREINKIYGVGADIDKLLYYGDPNFYSIDSNRLNDLELTDDNKVLFSKPSTVDTTNVNFLGVDNGIQTKMKITVYFWFEGWDADCMRFIDTKVASLNLAFSTENDSNNG